jgi:branched-chain amino acid transport system ATP-binding protein
MRMRSFEICALTSRYRRTPQSPKARREAAAQVHRLVRARRNSVEQDVQLSLEVADYAYMLENGAVVLEGPARELLSSDSIKTSYLGL